MTEPAFVAEISLDELESDPYPTYARLRREAPVAWIPAAGVWFVTTFDTCAEVGEGQRGFAGAQAHPTLQRVFGKPNVLTSDGETHADLRRGIDPKLQPAAVNEVVDSLVRPVARRYLTALAGRTSCELMTDYLEPVSVEALRAVMGLDELVDADTLRRWFRDLNLGVANFGLDAEAFAVADAASREIEDVVRPHLEHLSAVPDDSMLSHMLWTGRPADAPRSVELLLPSLKVLLLGGMQEPGHAAGSALLGLLTDEQQWQLLCNDPDEMIPLAVNEGLRWIAPIGAVERQASHDVELNGRSIRAGDIVQVVIASANRDESRFVDADRFDLQRSGRNHQAFGNGEHFCAGHFFARQVEQIMLEELVSARPGIRLDPDRTPKVSGWVFRAPKSLPVVWDRTAPAPITASKLEARLPTDDTRMMRVEGMRVAADGILSIELSAADGSLLPRWEPGAHLDLWPDPTAERAGQYSISSSPGDRRRWRIAVLREPSSRGVSSFVHEQLRPGDTVVVGGPRNSFPLELAQAYTFIAGGIGITPVLPMARAAVAAGADVEIEYCGRTSAGMAFRDELLAMGVPVTLHVSQDGRRADLTEILKRAKNRDAAVYACGPTRMLDHLEAAGAAGGIRVVTERFTGGEPHRQGDRKFTLVLAGSGQRVEVAADTTAWEALRDQGINVRHACREGNCGSCETRVVSGKVDHRDVLLTARQRGANDRMMVCVSRAIDDELTIDL